MQHSLFPDLELKNIGDIETWCVDNDYSFVIGVDEAGRGPLAGPVHASAVALFLDKLDEDWVLELNDSKKLNEKKRINAAKNIREFAMAYSVRFEDEKKIDEINILQATLLAMKKAVEDVVKQVGREPDCVFIDGNKTIDIPYTQEALVKGDGRSRAIAAASILAKTDRDALMYALDKEWPEYGFARHKGYPTKKHREAVAEHGPCIHHRQSFAGVREHIARLRKAPHNLT